MDDQAQGLPLLTSAPMAAETARFQKRQSKTRENPHGTLSGATRSGIFAFDFKGIDGLDPRQLSNLGPTSQKQSIQTQRMLPATQYSLETHHQLSPRLEASSRPNMRQSQRGYHQQETPGSLMKPEGTGTHGAPSICFRMSQPNSIKSEFSMKK